jgi:hypothetical protein
LFIGSVVPSINETVEDSVVIRKPQCGLVVDPFSEIDMNTEMWLIPIHFGETVGEIIGHSKAALPPTDGCICRNKPIPAPSGSQVTN